MNQPIKTRRALVQIAAIEPTNDYPRRIPAPRQPAKRLAFGIRQTGEIVRYKGKQYRVTFSACGVMRLVEFFPWRL